jgi:thymidylate synthase (FAD)
VGRPGDEQKRGSPVSNNFGSTEQVELRKAPIRSEHFARASVPAMDEILGRPFNVLDKGFVCAVDYMGDDAAVVQAARVSYGVGTKSVQNDRALIRYLMRHSHTTPFEMCEIKLHVRVPMDTWRQWIRHRTANVNEYSTRYSMAIDAAQRTRPDEWRQQSVENRQGSGGGRSFTREEGERFSSAEEELQNKARAIYEERIAAGIAREQARKDLPLSTYTEAYWKIDLHNLLHFLQLRMDEHAQSEIRAYASVIGEEIVARWTPIVWGSFLDYRKNALQLSSIEVKIITALTSEDFEAARIAAVQYGMLNKKPDGALHPGRECKELEQKLSILGLNQKWY